VRAKLVKIGNPRGLRLAKPLLEQASLSDSVEIQAAPWVLSIRPVAAPRAVYRAKLTGSLQKNEYDNLFCGSACFVGAPEGHYDALIVDESHRLMIKTIYNQDHLQQGGRELDQGDHPRQQTDRLRRTFEIEQWSLYHEAELHRDQLPSQFRVASKSFTPETP